MWQGGSPPALRERSAQEEDVQDHQSIGGDGDGCGGVSGFPGKNGRIAYTSYDGNFPKGDLEIYTINPDGSGKTRLTNNNTDELDLSYTPDGKRIVYSGQDGPKGDLEIYTINACGGISSK